MEDDNLPEGEETKKLSAAQKKKLKEKQKKEKEAADAAAKAAAGEPVEDKAEKEPAGGKAKKKGGKPINAAAALALEKQRLINEAKAEQERLEREEREKEEAEERVRQEAEKKVREEEERKKKEKLDKIQDLKDQGKWLSKKEMIKKKAMDAKRAELIAQGVIQPDDDDEEDDQQNQKKQSNIIRAKKKDKKVKTDQNENQTTNEQEKELHTEKQIDSQAIETKVTVSKQQQVEQIQEDDVVDDWEAADIDEIAGKVKVEPNAIQIKNTKEDEDRVDLLLAAELEAEKKKGAKKPTAQKGKAKEEEKEQAQTDLFSVTVEDEATKALRLAQRKEENLRKIKERNAKIKAQKDRKLRCPIVCILGHVDTGKTKILDKLRKTNVQAGEAGGITQQIGATFFPREYIESHLSKMKGRVELDLELPGFLVIDTPGHESFTNLRSRGSSLCDIAILVVDLMHGLEPQTLESIELLKQKKCPFIIALNKIDRCYQWKSVEYRNARDALEDQIQGTLNEFNDRVQKTNLAFAEIGFNTALYWDNNEPEEFLSFCPTSAITGEGLSDLMAYLCMQCQTRIPKQLVERDEFECTVLEVKMIEGLGATIDVVLLNGTLKIQDTIVLQGFNGPIVTQVRALLTPQPLKEMRVKAEYIHHQKIKGAMGIKISAPNLEHAIAGSELLKATGEAEIAAAKAEIEDNLIDILDKYVDKNSDGVCVQASTLGSLEALLEFLKTTAKIPVASISIGPVHKNDVMKATKALQGDQKNKKKEFATLLAFDVRVTPEAQQFADKEGVKIFTANIIYHLFDEFTKYVKQCADERKNAGSGDAIFPCVLEIIKDAVFNRQDPIIIGVKVKAGFLKIGTPLCIPEKDNLRIGVVENMEINKKAVKVVYPKDGDVAIRISGQPNIAFGRQFEADASLCSWQTRKSIDALKEFFRDELTMDDWKLVKLLKTKYKIE